MVYRWSNRHTIVQVVYCVVVCVRYSVHLQTTAVWGVREALSPPLARLENLARYVVSVVTRTVQSSRRSILHKYSSHAMAWHHQIYSTSSRQCDCMALSSRYMFWMQCKRVQLVSAFGQNRRCRASSRPRATNWYAASVRWSPSQDMCLDGSGHRIDVGLQEKSLPELWGPPSPQHAVRATSFLNPAILRLLPEPVSPTPILC